MIFDLELLIAFTLGVLAQSPPTYFEGKRVTLQQAKLDESSFATGGPASVCIESSPEPKCFSAPKPYVRNTRVELIRINKDKEALFFKAKSNGVSSWQVFMHFSGLERDHIFKISSSRRLPLQT